MQTDNGSNASADRYTISVPRLKAGGALWPISLVIVAGIAAGTYLQIVKEQLKLELATEQLKLELAATRAPALDQYVAPSQGVAPSWQQPAQQQAWQIPPKPAQQIAPAAAPVPQPASEFVATSDPSVRTIPDAAIAAKVFELLGKLPSIGSGPASDRPIYAFFDPRCPYCHRAFDALEGGDMPIRWIPVAVVGEAGQGIAISRAILTAQTPLAAMGEALDGKLTGVPAASEELERGLSAAFESFVTLTTSLKNARGGQAGPLGVPTFIVPSSAGTATAIIGFDPAIKDKLRAAYSGS